MDNSPHIRCRHVNPNDAPTLHARCMPEKSLKEVQALVSNAMYLARERAGVGIIALWDGEIAGFGMLTFLPSTAEISNLIVVPELRGHGIGTAVIAYLTQTAREMHAQSVEIGAAATNPRALALYRRLGFMNKRHLHLNFNTGPETIVYLRKALTGLGG